MKISGQAKQNNLLLKFLIIATTFFITLVGILFWQQREVDSLPIPTEQPIIRFSDKGKLDDIMVGYSYNARYIHDIEAYPEIKNIFFTDSFPQLKDKNKISEALAEVKQQKETQNEFGKNHVYSTSYYIGNLLISPDLTLHALLADANKPNTSILLDTALADVRSGVIKIQNFFDVAPPVYYDDSYAGATYFSTASFPSLTVTEAGIVLYLLAEIDPDNARVYEQFLHQYSNQVLSSGANFYLDIEYGLRLVSAYFTIIKESPDYKKLLIPAMEEWAETQMIPLANNFEIKFLLNNFPYESRFKILKPKVNSYKSATANEKLSGSLMLTLVDNRLPDPAAKLYQYDIAADSLLPFAVDLQGRKFTSLGKAVANFAGIDQDRYFFVSGDSPVSSEAKDIFFTNSKISYREGNTVTPLYDANDGGTNTIQKNVELSSGQDRLLYNQLIIEQKSNPDSWEIKLDKLSQAKLLKGEVIARGSSPVLALFGETVLFWREGGVWQINTNSGFEQKIITFTKQKFEDEITNLDYLEATKTLVVTRSFIDLETLETKTDLSIHKIEKSVDNSLITKKVYEVEIKDARVLSVRQSPGGSYLALLVNQTIGETQPKLLIFNVNDGIISKELDLLPYSNKAMMIDEWLVSE